MKRYQFLFILIALIVFQCSPKHETADLVIYGGTIYTMDAAQPVVEAVAVTGGVIKFAGKGDEAKQWIADKTQVIDLKGMEK